MPSYDYECISCGHRFEMFQKITDEPVKDCPECGNQVRRLIAGGMGVIFKGNGFYVTDNRKGSSNLSGNNGKSKQEKDKRNSETMGEKAAEKKS